MRGRIHPLIICLPALLILILASSAVFSSSNVLATTLPNGMKVIVREEHAVNLAAVDIWVKAGSVCETPDKNGVAHLVEHMIFKATKKYGPGQIDKEIEGLGAELNGGTSKDWVHFYTTVASEYLSIALDALADAVVNAQFRPEDIEKERQVVLDEIARAENNPSQRAFNLFSQVAFSVHPYSLPPTGSRDSVSRLTREDLISFYRRYYRPENTCVVIVGDVSQETALELVKKAFSGFEGRGRPTEADSVPPTEPPPAGTKVRHFKSLNGKTYVVVGYQAPPASEFSDACALDVILAVLGDTYRGRIASALNAKGIQFSSINTDFITQRYPTTFSVCVATQDRDTNAIISAILSELQRLSKEPLSTAELTHGKRMVEGSDLFEQETVSGQARALGLYATVASFDLALKYGETVRNITAVDIMSVAKKYFTNGNCYVAVISNQLGEQNDS
ncbi:MAG: M16 family metallopeptidase [Armatimonadota bacterium]